MPRHRIGIVVAALAVAITGAAAFAETVQDASNERGFVAGKAYDFGGLDSVNLFSGALSLTRPIGPSYQVGPHFSYGLTLAYSSKAWEYVSCIQQFIALGPVEIPCEVAGAPSPLWNAGHGWRLGFGLLIDGPFPPSGWEPYQYLQVGYHSPDGAVHPFFTTLHDDDWGNSEQGEPCRPTDTACYTRDGSYLRLDRTGPNRVLEFPDGSRHVFGQDAQYGRWMPTRMEDAFGNGVTVEYLLDLDVEPVPVWRVWDDRRGSEREPTLEITFEDDCEPFQPCPPPGGWGLTAGWRVATVDYLVDAPGGVPRTATINFDYSRPTLETAPRPECGSLHGWGRLNPDSVKPYLGGMLATVRQTASGDAWNWGFEYFLHGDDDGGNPDPEDPCDDFAGQLKAMVLPTGARVEWTYGGYKTPAMDCIEPNGTEPPSGEGPYINPALAQVWGGGFGVVTRNVYPPPPPLGSGDTAPISRRLYTGGSLYWPFLPGCGPGALRRPIQGLSNVKYEWIGNEKVAREETYFSTYALDLPGTDFRETEYGLPLTRAHCEAGALVCAGLTQALPNPRVIGSKSYYLSTTLHRCGIDDTTSTYDWPNFRRILHPSCELYQARYVRYESSFPYCDTAAGDCSRINSRVAGEIVVHYDPDVAPQAAGWELSEAVTDRERFNGFGAYRVTRTGGDFPGPQGGDAANVREEVQELLPEGEMVLNADVTSVLEYSVPNLGNLPWLFTRSSRNSVSEPGKGTATTEVCYDDEGFLKGRRSLKDANGQRSTRDVVVTYARGADMSGGDGFVTGEFYSGGDRTAPLDLCTPSATGSEYQTRHLYQHATLAESFVQRHGADFLRRVENVVDPSGRVEASLDVSGVQTEYDYDDLGRLIEIRRPATATTTVSYATTAPGGPTVDVLQKGAGGAVLTEAHYHYDALGRLVRERKKMPGSAPGSTREAVKCTRYLETGQLKRQTDFLDGATCPDDTAPVWTVYGGYDPLGRVDSVTQPDGAQHIFNYLGVESKTEVRSVRTEGAGLSEVKKKFFYNRQGNLIHVVEDFTGAEPLGRLKTKYAYDVNDRLTRVEQIDDSAGSSQVRLFNYDKRGFLLSEKHPEIGAAGNGTISYSDYDSMGHAGSRRFEVYTLPRDWSFDLDYRYDAAGRLTQVLHDGHVDKQYFYSRGTEAGAWGRGKLYQVWSRNEVLSRHESDATGRVAITESFSYDDAAGRATTRALRSSDGVMFDAAFSYDLLGNLARLDYPRCRYPAGCDQAAPALAVIPEYRWGYLTAIPGYADSVTYHANGMAYEVAHANGVVDRQTLYRQSINQSAIGLPGRFEFLRGGTPLLTLGDYGYDHERNVTAIGDDQYYYDRLSRLSKADLTIGATIYVRRYVYDRFSNLTSIATLPSIGPANDRQMNASAATNRLTGEAFAYDQAGNLTLSFGAARRFDAHNQMVDASGTGINRAMLYTASGERVAVLDEQTARETWSIRGLDEKVLRQVQRDDTDTWQLKEDYVYRGGALLAARKPGAGGVLATEHFHLDHLGSTRLITDSGGNAVGGAMKYWPYGEIAEGPSGGEVMRFTGHERDFNCRLDQCDPQTTAQTDDIDYMHARYYSSWLGRFLSVDSLASQANRYEYARSNPIRLLDPDGRLPLEFRGDSADIQEVQGTIARERVVNPDFDRRMDSLVASEFRTIIHVAPASLRTFGTLGDTVDGDETKDGTGTHALVTIYLGEIYATKSPLEATLVHEFVHAENAQHGIIDRSPTNCLAPPCASIEETQAVRAENEVRVRLGLEPRDTYGAQTVPCPTCPPFPPLPPARVKTERKPWDPPPLDPPPGL